MIHSVYETRAFIQRVFCIGKIVPALLFWIISFPILSTDRKTDSLLAVLKVCRNDPGKAALLNAICWEFYMKSQFDTAEYYANEAHSVAEKILEEKNRNPKVIAAAKNEMGDAFSRLGNIRYYQGDYPEALRYYLKALKVYEEIRNKPGCASIHVYIGNVHFRQRNMESALESNFTALKLLEGSGQKTSLGAIYNSLGMIYNAQQKYGPALENYFKALWYTKESGDKQGITALYNNIAVIHYNKNDFPGALRYFKESMKIHEEMGDRWGLATSYGNIGTINGEDSRFIEAEKYLKKAIALSEQVGDKEQLMDWHNSISSVYERTGRYRMALEHFKRHILYRDSLQNEENTRKTIETQMQYDFDKKTTADSIKNSASKKTEAIRHKQEISRQRMYTYGGATGFLVMIVVATISVLAFRNKKKANQEIARQKAIVEEKQKEILDSIHYAKRIQTALLTNEKYISRKINALKRIAE